MKKLLVICLLMLACDPVQMKKDRLERDEEQLTKNLSYYKDTRTHLCFAGMGAGYNYGLLTNVPCTPEVENLTHSFTSEK